MLTTSARSLTALLVLSLAFVVMAVTARADLVWEPATGWRAEGGVLGGLFGDESRNALELMNKARASEEKGSKGSAISSYTKVVKKYPNSIYAPEAYYRLGKLRLARRQYLKSHTAFQEVVTRYPNTTRFNEIISEQYRIASLLLDGARPRYFGWIPGFKNRSKGVEYFEKILLAAPYSDYAPLALMNVARGYQRLGKDEEAIDALDRMINTYPQNLLAPDAYLKLAQAHASLVEGAYYDQSSTKEAITYFEDFMILFPSDNGVPKAETGLVQMKKVFAESKMKIGDFYFYKRSNYKAARVFYNEAITVSPDSPEALVARERLAEVDAKENKSKDPNRSRKQGKRFWVF